MTCSALPGGPKEGQIKAKKDACSLLLHSFPGYSVKAELSVVHWLFSAWLCVYGVATVRMKVELRSIFPFEIHKQYLIFSYSLFLLKKSLIDQGNSFYLPSCCLSQPNIKLLLVAKGGKVNEPLC